MLNNQSIQVFEHESLRIGQKGFTDKQWDALVKLNEFHEGKYFNIIHKGIKFTEYVGVIQAKGVTLEILPKIDKEEDTDWREVLIAMLKVCKKLSPDAHGEAKVKRQNLNLLELYFELFLDEVNHLIRLGLLKQYRKETKNVQALKGKLEFAGHLNRNSIHKERFYTTHSVYDQNHKLHQILKEALLVISNMTKGSFLNDKCRRVMMDFPEVERLNVRATLFEKLILNRKSKPYEKAIELARLIILNYSPDIRGGKENMLAILFDMNTLWEEYVLRILQKASKDFESMEVSGQAKKKFWEKRTVRPDIVIKYNGVTSIIDTKWKRVINSRASIEDLRQMYVYNKYWGAKKSMLLYPKSGLDKNNITGSYYKDKTNEKDENNSCEIGYLDVLENGQLNNNWGRDFINKNIENLLF